jgi:hypothetical protein
MKSRLVVLLVSVLLATSHGVAHSGGLDSLGCHHDRKRGGYHCHRGPLAGQSFASKDEALKALEAGRTSSTAGPNRAASGQTATNSTAQTEPKERTVYITRAAVVGCGEHCGTERWPVKTLSDNDRSKVDFTQKEATVAWLVSQKRPHNPPQDARVAPIETQTFQVRANLIGFKQETDRDFHIVIADLQEPQKTMIVEIPDVSCAGACASGHTAEFEKARADVVNKLGPPFTRFKRLKQSVPVTVIGVGFFDFKHGQTGVALNAIELHPVLKISFEK